MGSKAPKGLTTVSTVDELTHTQGPGSSSSCDVIRLNNTPGKIIFDVSNLRLKKHPVHPWYVANFMAITMAILHSVVYNQKGLLWQHEEVNKVKSSVLETERLYYTGYKVTGCSTTHNKHKYGRSRYTSPWLAWSNPHNFLKTKMKCQPDYILCGCCLVTNDSSGRVRTISVIVHLNMYRLRQTWARHRSHTYIFGIL